MYYGFFDPLSVVFHVIGWILIVWLIVWIIRGARMRRYHYMHGMHSMWCDGTNCNHPSHGSNAMNVLKERFAKGEISKEEYEERKKTLQG
ncbi:MAG TPA: SHOCT domain-containing protein [Candidatus Paceibacterota bacterium]|jgi:uncharacterized membrane protein|nr:SHOCT domain-containing protein [Candidatus Paceibacterota bacterium]